MGRWWDRDDRGAGLLDHGLARDAVERCLWSDLLRLILACGAGPLIYPGSYAAAARGALLIDMVDQGVITGIGGSLRCEGSAFSVPLAAELAAGLRSRPQPAIDVLLHRGRPPLDEFVGLLVECGIWRRRGLRIGGTRAGYDDQLSPRYRDARAQLYLIASGSAAPSSPRLAALSALARALHVDGSTDCEPAAPSLELIAACEHLGWIVHEVTASLEGSGATTLTAVTLGGW